MIGFDVTISNAGPGAAYGAQATDTLPGAGWAIVGAANGWSLVGSSLSFGPATLAAGAGATVHVERASTRAECGIVPNTVTGFATNEPAASQPNTASAQVTVVCRVLTLEKSNDAPVETIDLGDGVVVDLPTAEEGATVTFSLAYALGRARSPPAS